MAQVCYRGRPRVVMLSTELFRPTFLVRRLLREAGASDAWFDSRSDRGDIGHVLVNGNVEGTWAALDKLIVLLNLAGWECPELLVALPWRGDPSHDIGAVRMDVHGRVRFEADWRAATGLSPGAAAMQFMALRVEVRRSLGVDSLHPPIALDGVPGYVAAPNSDDDFADPRDGWITAEHGETLLADGAAMVLFEATHDLLAGLIVGALGRLDGGEAVGMLRSLDPKFWDTPADRLEPVAPFDALFAELWAWLKTPTKLDAFLRPGLDDRQVSLAALVKAAGARVSLGRGLRAMKARAATLRPRHAKLPTLLKGLGKTHWLLALMLLHEFGLIGIVPFPLAFEPLIPRLDLTGTYESDESLLDHKRRFYVTMQLVQAGDQIAAWIYDTDLDRWEFTGHVDETAGALEFYGDVLHPASNTTSSGRLEDLPARDTDNLRLKLKRGTQYYWMRRVDRAAVVDPELVESLVGERNTTLVNRELAPLHSELGAAMDAAIAHLVASIDEILDAWTWSTLVLALQGELEKILEDAGVIVFADPRRLVQTPTLERFRIRVRTLLPQHTVQGVDAWTQLLSIHESAGDYARGLRELLDLPDSLPHKYTYWSFGLGGSAEIKAIVGGGWSAYAIYFNLKHDDSCTPPGLDRSSHAWTAHYSGVTAGAGVGGGAEVKGQVDVFTTSDPNDLYSTTEWTKRDFVGAFFLVIGVDVHASVYVEVGGTYGVGAEAYVFFNGDKWASGTGNGRILNLGVGAGGGFGVGLGGTLGLIWSQVDSGRTPITKIEAAPEPLAVTVSDSAEGHFAFDSDELSDRAKHYLRRVACRYRALFERPGAFIQIEGDASPAGSEAYNERLSWRRALSVYAYLRSLLSAPASGEFGPSTAFAIAPSRVYILAYGESRARLAGVIDGVADKDWQRIKIVVSDALMVMM